MSKSTLKKLIIVTLAFLFSLAYLYIYENFFSEKDIFRNKGEDLMIVMDEGVTDADNLSIEIGKYVEKAKEGDKINQLEQFIESHETVETIEKIKENQIKVDAGMDEIKEIKFDFNQYQIQTNNYLELYDSYREIVNYSEVLINEIKSDIKKGEPLDNITLKNAEYRDSYNKVHEVVKTDLHDMGGEHRFSMRYLLFAFIPAFYLIFKKKDDAKKGDD